MITAAEVIVRSLRYSAALLLVASGLTCFVGPRYAVSRLSPAQRHSMTDTDWIGVEWIGIGMLLFAVAVVLILAAVVTSRRARRSKAE